MSKAKNKLHASATPRSIRDVTRFLAQSGVEGVTPERGRGFFYFAGVQVLNWLNDLRAAAAVSGVRRSGDSDPLTASDTRPDSG